MMAPMSIAVLALLAAILVILVVAVYWRNVPAIVNAVVSLFVAIVPILGAAFGRVVFDQPLAIPGELTLWIAAAGCLHSIGMLGPYDWIWWWDHLTHTVSAALVAALVYAGLLVIEPPVTGLGRTVDGIALLTVLLTFVIGIFWELIELVARTVGRRYGVEPILVNYGWRDTILDIVFDLLGALGIVLLDVRVFVPLAERDPGWTSTIFQGVMVFLLVGTVGMLLLLWTWFDGDMTVRS